MQYFQERALLRGDDSLYMLHQWESIRFPMNRGRGENFENTVVSPAAGSPNFAATPDKYASVGRMDGKLEVCKSLSDLTLEALDGF